MSHKDSQIPVSYIKECLRVDDGGILYWLERPRSHFSRDSGHTLANRFSGKRVGRVDKRGYVMLELSYAGVKYMLFGHRIAWALYTGAWPEQHIDHINRKRADNRQENLRDVPQDVNARNNGNKHGTGLFGAYPQRNSKKFKAQIVVDRKTVYLGLFATAIEAHMAAVRAAESSRSDRKNSP